MLSFNMSSASTSTSFGLRCEKVSGQRSGTWDGRDVGRDFGGLGVWWGDEIPFTYLIAGAETRVFPSNNKTGFPLEKYESSSSPSSSVTMGVPLLLRLGEMSLRRLASVFGEGGSSGWRCDSEVKNVSVRTRFGFFGLWCAFGRGDGTVESPDPGIFVLD
jgi:hypothetical protein